ncbi:N-acetylmuramoyl-L-alanine amidase [bacterium]|nr:N-acetylmuramoyl-L-alanine amidase [bacterium]
MQSKYVLKIGQSGDLVKVLQELLNIKTDGIFGSETKIEVIRFQKKSSLVSDGIVGPMTWLKLDYNPLELEADTDLTTGASWIQQHPLPEGEYVENKTPKKWIFIHHTAGRHNPESVIDQWARDQRGRVGTHYVIGGLPSSVDIDHANSSDKEWDGKILQAIKDEYWAYHLGAVKSSKMHRESISIELCSAGYLTEEDGKFYTWYGTEVHESQVSRLEKEYKGYRYYHSYSKEQIKALKALLLLISDKHGIDLNSGIVEMLKSSQRPGISQYYPIAGSPDVFNYNESACNGKIKGLLTHGQVRHGKSDVFPQHELINMLLSL